MVGSGIPLCQEQATLFVETVIELEACIQHISRHIQSVHTVAPKKMSKAI